jgi:hypothetical protein
VLLQLHQHQVKPLPNHWNKLSCLQDNPESQARVTEEVVKKKLVKIWISKGQQLKTIE